MSAEIPWDDPNAPVDASRMIDDYQNNVDIQLQVPVSGSDERLDGFTIDVDHIEAIINQELDPGREIRKIFIMMGVRPMDVGQSTQYPTIIVGGIDDQNNLVTSKVFDYNEPCPQACPNNW